MPLHLGIRRRVRVAWRRVVLRLVHDHLETAKEAAALRDEIAALDERLDELTARIGELLGRLEDG